MKMFLYVLAMIIASPSVFAMPGDENATFKSPSLSDQYRRQMQVTYEKEPSTCQSVTKLDKEYRFGPHITQYQGLPLSRCSDKIILLKIDELFANKCSVAKNSYLEKCQGNNRDKKDSESCRELNDSYNAYCYPTAPVMENIGDGWRNDVQVSWKDCKNATTVQISPRKYPMHYLVCTPLSLYSEQEQQEIFAIEDTVLSSF